MKIAQICRLEIRRLLSSTGGLSAVGQAITIATVPSQFVPFTASPIGTADAIYAYVKSGVVDAVILDASGNTVVPEFPISAQGDNVNQYGNNMAAVEDSNNNVAIVYSTNFGEDVNMVRVSDAGQIVDQPAVILQSGTDTFTPAIALGANNSVAVVVRVSSSGNGTSDSIYGGVFDSSDAPMFTPMAISTVASNAPGGALITNPSVVYTSANGNFLAAWDEEDLTTGATADTQELINANKFTSAGTIGTQQTIATALNTSDSDDVLNKPFFLPDSGGNTVSLYYDEDDFGPPPSYGFHGSNLFLATLNLDGSLNSTPVDVYSPAAPTEIQVTGIIEYPAITRDAVLSASKLSGEVKPLDGSTNPFDVVTCNYGAYSGGFSNSGPAAVTIQNGQYLAISFLPGNFENVSPWSSSYYYSYYDSSSGDTGIYSQPTTYTAPTTTPTVSVGNGVEGPEDMVFTISLSAASDQPVSVTAATKDGTAASGINYVAVNRSEIIPAGATSTTVAVPLRGVASSNTSFYLDISNPSGATLGTSEGTGTIAGSGGTTQTATPGHPATVTDAGGDIATFSTNAGSVSISFDSNGNPTVTATGTSGKTKILVGPEKSKKSKSKIRGVMPDAATTSFTIGDFTSTSPLGTIDAAGVNVLGNISLDGVMSATFGNIEDDHQVSLGALSNATLKFGTVAGTDLTSSGSIKSLSFNSWAGGSITAGAIAALSSAGNFDADMSVTSINKMTVGGILGGTSSSDYRQIRATSSFGTIAVGGLENANLFAGVSNSVDTLPADESAFVDADAFIKSLTIKGTSAIFSDTDVAATTIDAITIAGLQSANATEFGVVAEKILKYRQGKTSKSKITTPQTVDSSGQYSAKTV